MTLHVRFLLYFYKNDVLTATLPKAWTIRSDGMTSVETIFEEFCVVMGDCCFADWNTMLDTHNEFTEYNLSSDQCRTLFRELRRDIEYRVGDSEVIDRVLVGQVISYNLF